MESPQKKRKIANRGDHIPVASSTPHKGRKESTVEDPSVSGINLSSSNGNSNSNSTLPRSPLKLSAKSISEKKSILGLLTESSDSLAETFQNASLSGMDLSTSSGESTSDSTLIRSAKSDLKKKTFSELLEESSSNMSDTELQDIGTESTTEGSSKRISFSNLFEDSSNDLDAPIQDNDHVEDLDYDEFFKTCKKILYKGGVWQLYKPVSDEEGSLYYQITKDPRKAKELAKWFIQYSTNKQEYCDTYFLCRFYFDCSGYQNFNLKKYFTFPPNVEAILKKLNNNDFTNKILTTTKFLFADNTNLAKILKFGIYNFLHKYIIEAHEQRMLYKPSFDAFLKLLICMCKSANYRPLVYTAFIFVIKILTAIFLIKEKASNMPLDEKQSSLLDRYIIVIYICFRSVCQMSHKKLDTLKIAGLDELKIWIQYSPKVLINYCNCTDILKQLILDESAIVRLAALDRCMEILHNEKLISYLSKDSIRNLISHILERVYDIIISVQLKSIEVYTSVIENCSDVTDKGSIFKTLIEVVYHEDYRLGSAAGKCIIEMMSLKKDEDLILLIYLCEIAKKFHPELKSLFVESFIDHTNVLQNWHLMIDVLSKPTDKDLSVEIKSSLSELLLESVHMTLTGCCSKIRAFAKLDRTICPTHNKLIANELYPRLKRIIALHRDEDVIMQNMFKILVKIAPEYLTEDHCRVASVLSQLFMNFFIMWNNYETVDALINYLMYVNEHLPVVSSASRNAIENMKQYISENLYKSFESKDNETLIMAKKASVVFSKVDLNEHIEWSTLLSSCTIIESNAKFVEDILTSCHWSVMWRIKKLNTHSKPELADEISHIGTMSTQFFNKCYEIMKHEEKTLKFKAFERICESCISLCLGLENIVKQIRSSAVLKPIISDDVLTTEIMDFVESSADPNTPSNASRFRKYIMYIYQMACLEVLPMHCISTIFKYFDKYYDSYGKLIEKILIAIHEKSQNWIAQLIVDSISLLHEDIFKKHGVVDIKTKEAKVILGLSKRFQQFKKIMNSNIAAKLLVFAVNYVSVNKMYDFLIYVRPFTDYLKDAPTECKEILQIIRKRIPVSAAKNDYIQYFVEHLQSPLASACADKSDRVVRKVRSRRTVTPKRKVPTPKVKGKQPINKTPSQATTTSSESSDNMSIHDTTSDDYEFPSGINRT